MTLSNADKLRFAEVEDRITREFGDSDTMDFLEYLKQQDVENDLRQDSLEESIEFLVNECGELQKEVNEYRQQEETKLTETLDLTQLTNRIQGWAVDSRFLSTAHPWILLVSCVRSNASVNFISSCCLYSLTSF